MNLVSNSESYKTFAWWKLLCLIAFINIILWSWVVATYEDTHSNFYIHATLSGVYILVCAFRSFFPRIDLERYCLHDTPLSSIALGRTCATLAEICFSIQCALTVYSLAIAVNCTAITFVAYLVVPLVMIAQLFCWYATLTLNHFWHGIEEMTWVIMLILVGSCFLAGFFLLTPTHKILMAIGFISCLASIYIMLFIDIPMYLSRSKIHQRRLTFKEGISDALLRRVHTKAWTVWKKEVLWLTSYFTFGVWLSISMVVIQFHS